MDYPWFIVLFSGFLALITVTHIWVIYSLLIFKLVVKEKYTSDYLEPTSIIIPCYNENPLMLKACVESCINTDGKNEVILVDNNSNDPDCLEMIRLLKNTLKIKVLIEKRQGKRFAHSKGLSKAKHQIIVFVDSDTILEKGAILGLIRPMQDEKIGGCCGNIKIKNNDKFFTKCLDTMYWNSFEFYRYAVSSLGYLYVCSGALSAYRKNLLLKLEEEYLNQKFLGNPAQISDDTFTTIRIQSRFGKRIAFCRDAIAYTYSPETFKGFWKQLLRWRLGFLRESFLMWKEPKKNIIFLFLDTQYNLLMQTSVILLRILFFVGLILNFSFPNLFYYITFFVISILMLSAYQIIMRPEKIVYIISYSFLYDFFFVFTVAHAYLTIKNQGKWGTR